MRKALGSVRPRRAFVEARISEEGRRALQTDKPSKKELSGNTHRATGSRQTQIKYAQIGVCGLSCRLCPRYHTQGKSRCYGCKTESRMVVGCPFITCAVMRKGIEFCWDCAENESCDKWHKHRRFGRRHDTFVSYQTLDDNISFIRSNGVEALDEVQRKTEKLLKEALSDFNEGRSKTYYCVAAALLKVDEFEQAVSQARKDSATMDLKGKSLLLHSLLDETAGRERHQLKLRK